MRLSLLFVEDKSGIEIYVRQQTDKRKLRAYGLPMKWEKYKGLEIL